MWAGLILITSNMACPTIKKPSTRPGFLVIIQRTPEVSDADYFWFLASRFLSYTFFAPKAAPAASSQAMPGNGVGLGGGSGCAYSAKVISDMARVSRWDVFMMLGAFIRVEIGFMAG